MKWIIYHGWLFLMYYSLYCQNPRDKIATRKFINETKYENYKIACKGFPNFCSWLMYFPIKCTPKKVTTWNCHNLYSYYSRYKADYFFCVLRNSHIGLQILVLHTRHITGIVNHIYLAYRVIYVNVTIDPRDSLQ